MEQKIFDAPKSAIEFFEGLLIKLDDPKLLSQFKSPKSAIGSVSIWTAEQMSELELLNPSLAREVVIIANNKDSSIVKMIKTKFDQNDVSPEVRDHFFKSLEIKRAN